MRNVGHFQKPPTDRKWFTEGSQIWFNLASCLPFEVHDFGGMAKIRAIAMGIGISSTSKIKF